MHEPVESLVLSACLGALTGLIRQWETQQEAAQAREFAGLRSFTLVSMLGCLAAFIAEANAPGTFVASFAALALLLAASLVSRAPDPSRGYTTPVAALLTFLVGALVFWGERQAAVVTSALTMILVGLKQPIHAWTRRFTASDLRSALQFVAITGVILPLVPDRTLDPYGAFNPRSAWLMVVLISGIGFLGFLLMRLLGSTAGITLTGLVGGLASSTATTLAFSRRSRETPGESDTCALAVVLACNVMLVRVLVVVGALHLPTARNLLLPLVIMVIPGLVYAGWMWLRPRHASGPVDTPLVRNPLSLSTAIQFGLLYAGVKLALKLASGLGADRSIVVVSAVAGLTDVDAIAVSLSEGARDGSVGPGLASVAVVTGCIANTLLKAGMGATLGSPGFRNRVLAVLGATALAGGLGWFLVGLGAR